MGNEEQPAILHQVHAPWRCTSGSVAKSHRSPHSGKLYLTRLDSVQKGDFVKTKSLLADDFQFSGPIPEPINRDAWLEMSAILKTAFPDLDYHFKVIGADDDVVKTTSQLSGTHRGSFDLTNMKMGVIPPTNKTFDAKLEKTKITVKDNKITSWVVEPTEGAGLKAILGQLGVKLPTVV